MNIDSAIENFLKLKPSRYGYLEKIHLERSVDPRTWTGYTLTLILRAKPDSISEAICMVFSGMVDFNVRSLEGLFSLVIDIESIRDQQLEGRIYRVAESETDAFSFDCRDFTAKIIHQSS